jgi:hypothetical protein
LKLEKKKKTLTLRPTRGPTSYEPAPPADRATPAGPRQATRTPHPAPSPAPAPKCRTNASSRQVQRAPRPRHRQAPTAPGTQALKPQPRRSSSSALLELQSSRYSLPHYSLSPLTTWNETDAINGALKHPGRPSLSPATSPLPFLPL